VAPLSSLQHAPTKYLEVDPSFPVAGFGRHNEFWFALVEAHHATKFVFARCSRTSPNPRHLAAYARLAPRALWRRMLSAHVGEPSHGHFASVDALWLSNESPLLLFCTGDSATDCLVAKVFLVWYSIVFIPAKKQIAQFRKP